MALLSKREKAAGEDYIERGTVLGWLIERNEYPHVDPSTTAVITTVFLIFTHFTHRTGSFPLDLSTTGPHTALVMTIQVLTRSQGGSAVLVLLPLVRRDLSTSRTYEAVGDQVRTTKRRSAYSRRGVRSSLDVKMVQ